MGVGQIVGRPASRARAAGAARDGGGAGPNDFPVNKTFARGRHPARGGRRGLAADARRGRATSATPDPRRAAGDAPDRRRPADRLRRGLVDHPALDGRAPARPRPAWRARRATRVEVRSLQPSGTFSRATLNRGQVRAPATRCWRCRVNGEDLSLDHGFPARIMVPRCPACTTPSGSGSWRSRERASATSTAPARCTCSPSCRASASPSGRCARCSACWPTRENFVLWFAGAIVLHDLLLLPLYSALGVVAGRRARARGAAHAACAIAALNHLRIPALLVRADAAGLVPADR